MRPFRFRAQAALDLRRREHDEALQGQARAQRTLAEAARAVAEAAGVVRAAEQRLSDAMRGSLDHAQLEWHHAWRVRCAGEQAQAEARRQEQHGVLQRAVQEVSVTYRRVRSLERLRDHARLAWVRLAQQEERKTMDALAASRFVQGREER